MPISSVKVKNDDQRLKDELEALKSHNAPLRDLIFDLADWIKETFNKELVITMIYRTNEEQAEIYKDNPKYKKKPFKSVHQFWAGVDIRSFIYTKEEIKAIETYLNTKYNSTNAHLWTALCHNVGKGDHFHVQFQRK